ncbi:MAG: 4Fe-4S binding protein [Candidatus Lokiarchaeia archaeon]|nr:4Fe-4S binding protein [Candidatus Lokiarchaeia archaeon]
MNLKDIKLRNHLVTIFRRIIQIIAFLIINYIILELVFSINLIGLKGILTVFPVLNSPRNPLSNGTGIVEMIFYMFTDGIIPIFLIGVFILIILFTNRFFCGWICPVGTIQDACAAIPSKKKTIRIAGGIFNHKSLLKIKYVIVIFVLLLVVPLAITANVDSAFYIEYRDNLGDFGTKPLSYFSLSEMIFVFFPQMIWQIIITRSIAPIFANPIVFFISIFYIALLVLSVWYPRLYCRYFCPFAALSSIISKYSFLKLSRSTVKCVGRAECGECERVCPKQIRMLDEPFEFFTGNGECNLCMRCKEACPYKAIEIKIG